MVERIELSWTPKRILALLGLFGGLIVIGIIPTLFHNWKTKLELATNPQNLHRRLMQELPGEAYFLRLKELPAFVIIPEKQKNNGKGVPWVWLAPISPKSPNEAHMPMFRAFLDAGIAVAGIDVGQADSNAIALEAFSLFYERMRKDYALAPKAVLLVRGDDGELHRTWALDHADRVAGIAEDDADVIQEELPEKVQHEDFIVGVIQLAKEGKIEKSPGGD